VKHLRIAGTCASSATSAFRREWLKDRREALGWQLETERRSAGSGRKGRDVCRPQPRCGQVASRRTRESSRDQRPTPAGARLTGGLAFHSRGPSKPPSRNVEHDRGEPPGSAVDATLKRKWRVASELCSARVSRPRRSADRRKCWQRIELGIGLNSWTVKCLEMSRKRGVQAARNGPSP